MRNERRAGAPRASPNLIVNSGFEYDEDGISCSLLTYPRASSHAGNKEL